VIYARVGISRPYSCTKTAFLCICATLKSCLKDSSTTKPGFLHPSQNKIYNTAQLIAFLTKVNIPKEVICIFGLDAQSNSNNRSSDANTMERVHDISPVDNLSLFLMGSNQTDADRVFRIMLEALAEKETDDTKVCKENLSRMASTANVRMEPTHPAKPFSTKIKKATAQKGSVWTSSSNAVSIDYFPPYQEDLKKLARRIMLLYTSKIDEKGELVHNKQVSDDVCTQIQNVLFKALLECKLECLKQHTHTLFNSFYRYIMLRLSKQESHQRYTTLVVSFFTDIHYFMNEVCNEYNHTGAQKADRRTFTRDVVAYAGVNTEDDSALDYYSIVTGLTADEEKHHAIAEMLHRLQETDSEIIRLLKEAK
jgi:hypothetical protein